MVRILYLPLCLALYFFFQDLPLQHTPWTGKWRVFLKMYDHSGARPLTIDFGARTISDLHVDSPIVSVREYAIVGGTEWVVVQQGTWDPEDRTVSIRLWDNTLLEYKTPDKTYSRYYLKKDFVMPGKPPAGRWELQEEGGIVVYDLDAGRMTIIFDGPPGRIASGTRLEYPLRPIATGDNFQIFQNEELGMSPRAIVSVSDTMALLTNVQKKGEGFLSVGLHPVHVRKAK